MTASIIIFVLALILVGGAGWLFVHAGQRERQEEVLLRLRASGGDEAAALTGLEVSNRQISNPVLRWMCHLVWRSGVEMEPGTVARVMLVMTLLIPITLFAFGFLAGVIILTMLVLISWLVLNRKAAGRRHKIVEQLPTFLESAIRVLAAGNTLEESFAAAARESPDPIRPLFMSVGRQVRLGAPIETVLADAAEIHQIHDLKVLALAASVNRKFGGSLRNILRSLIYAIRSRDTATRELRALTAETRFSAWVLSIIPVAIMLFIVVQNPGYYTEMWADKGGRMLLIASVVMQLSGVAVIFRMMRSAEDGI